jgi:hypothetical protein
LLSHCWLTGCVDRIWLCEPTNKPSDCKQPALLLLLLLLPLLLAGGGAGLVCVCIVMPVNACYMSLQDTNKSTLLKIIAAVTAPHAATAMLLLY